MNGNTREADREKLIVLADVPALPWLPKRPGLSTVHRWAATGVRGHRLRTVRVGASLATTEGWLMEFFERSAGNPSPAPAAAAGAPHVRTRTQRDRAVARAERELEQAGI